MKKILISFCALALTAALSPALAEEALLPDSLIKASGAAVYYYAQDGKRYVFPNEKTYKSWYTDFSSVKIVSDSFLATLPIGGNVTYRPGIKMVKIQTDPKVYAVSGGGALRWIKTEELAKSLYGADWNQKIDDVQDAFFVNYKVGNPIESAGDFNPDQESKAFTTISQDKGIVIAKAPEEKKTEETPLPTPVWNKKIINEDSYYHKNLTLTNFNNGYLATWHDDRNGQNEIFYQKTDAGGQGEGITIKVSSNISDSTGAKALSDGANLYVLWEDASPLNRAIYSQKFDLLNNKSKLSLFTSSTYATSRYPDFAWNESLNNYGIVWWDTKSSLSSVGDLYFSFVTRGGLKTGSELKVTGAPASDFKPKIISLGDKFAVIWQGDDKIIKYALINRYGSLSVAPKDIATSTLKTEAKIAWNGVHLGLVWEDTEGDNKNIYYLKLDVDGNKAGERVALTSGAGAAAEPDIIWGENKFYVAYTNYKPNASGSGAPSDVRILKIDSDGKVAEKEQSISTANITAHLPRLAKNGLNAAVSWLEDSGSVNKIMAAVEIK